MVLLDEAEGTLKADIPPADLDELLGEGEEAGGGSGSDDDGGGGAGGENVDAANTRPAKQCVPGSCLGGGGRRGGGCRCANWCRSVGGGRGETLRLAEGTLTELMLT